MAYENDWIADSIGKIKTDTWVSKSWNGLSSINGGSIWTDGNDIYYSNGGTSDQYVLDKSTSTWSAKTWTGLSYITGKRIWTDGDNIYYSSGRNSQYVLNKLTSTWSSKTWTGLTEAYGEGIWTDGDNIYYSDDIYQYVLNKNTSTWSTKVWNGLSVFEGEKVWTDGDNIYYSYDSEQYVLNKTTSTWIQKTWTGLTSFRGDTVWTDGNNIYCSNGSNQYVLNKETSTWTQKTWSGTSNFYGYYIWTDGDEIYYSYSNNQYVLKTKQITSIPYRQAFPEMIESEDIADLWVADVLYYTREWTNISSDWSFSFDGQDVWTDGNDIYISCAGRRADYVLNKGTLLWETKSWTWEGGRPSPFGGRNIWTDGTDMYYSYGTTQYVLNKSENKWYKKTWTGLTSFYGGGVWSDGINVYYSMGDQQYVLDIANSTWDVKTWDSMPNFYGGYIWSDGTNIYYSKQDQSSGQRVLNKATSTWETVTWYRSTGSTFNPDGQRIWTDGTDMYYSSSFDHYVLNKSDMKWYTKTWTGLSYISSGAYIWNYGEHVYYSYSSTQYELKKNAVTSVPYRLRFPALIESIDIADVWLIDDDIPFRYNFPTLIKSHDKPKIPPCSFTFKGISSAEFGSAEMLPLCLKHEEKTDFINFVSGSPLVRETSIMRSKVITITLGLKDISPENIDKINSWLIGTGKLILSNDPDRYYIATCNNALTGQRILTLGKLPVQFNVLPYKYDNEEDDSFELVDLQDELSHKTVSILYQGNAPSEPVYKITATGNVQIYNVQSGNTFEIQGLTEYCIIDIKAKKVTDENDNVILDHTYGDIFDLMLIPGDNYFFLSGSITEFEVKRKTRWY